jgi:hypothetical protein
MRKVDQAGVKSKAEADKILQEVEPVHPLDPPAARFLG